MPQRRISVFRNWISFSGFTVMVGSLFSFLLLLLLDSMAHFANPYVGILTYLVAPGFLAAHADPAHAVPLIEPGPGGARDLLVHGPLRESPRAETIVAHTPADPYAAVVGGDYGRTVQNALEQLVTGMASGQYPRFAPWLAGVGANMSVPGIQDGVLSPTRSSAPTRR